MAGFASVAPHSCVSRRHPGALIRVKSEPRGVSDLLMSENSAWSGKMTSHILWWLGCLGGVRTRACRVATLGDACALREFRASRRVSTRRARAFFRGGAPSIFVTTSDLPALHALTFKSAHPTRTGVHTASSAVSLQAVRSWRYTPIGLRPSPCRADPTRQARPPTCRDRGGPNGCPARESRLRRRATGCSRFHHPYETRPVWQG